MHGLFLCCCEELCNICRCGLGLHIPIITAFIVKFKLGHYTDGTVVEAQGYFRYIRDEIFLLTFGGMFDAECCSGSSERGWEILEVQRWEGERDSSQGRPGDEPCDGDRPPIGTIDYRHHQEAFPAT